MSTHRTVTLPYDRRALEVAVPDSATVLAPNPTAAIERPEAALQAALRNPIGTGALRDLVRRGQRVVIVTSDVTRPVPNRLLLTALNGELAAAGIPDEHVTILNGTGLHRPNSRPELEWMYGREILDRFEVVQHDARRDETLSVVGPTGGGERAELCSTYVDADFRIVTGFVEPHLFAGFSGGAKGVMPGVAGAGSIRHNHGFVHLSHPRARWCVAQGNPVFDEMREVVVLCPPQFLLNVTLDPGRNLTGVFAGDYLMAHDAAIIQAKRQYQVPVLAPFDIVVATNMGYPADANLYQSVKGMSVAREGVSEGGAIILVAGCAEGVGSDDYERLLLAGASTAGLLEEFASRQDTRVDQWQIQCQAEVQARARVFLYSALSREATAQAHLEYCEDVSSQIERLVEEAIAEGRRGSLLIMPHGQLTVPVLEESANVSTF